MTPLFWRLYTPSVLALFFIGIVAGWFYERGKVWYRRWRIRREMSAHERSLRQALRTHGYWLAEIDETERPKLEAVATAQDRATRRIH